MARWRPRADAYTYADRHADTHSDTKSFAAPPNRPIKGQEARTNYERWYFLNDRVSIRSDKYSDAQLHFGQQPGIH